MTLRLQIGADRSVRYQSLRIRRSLEEGTSQLQAVLTEPDFDARGQECRVFDEAQPRFRGVIETVAGSETRGYSATARSLPVALAVYQARKPALFRKTTTTAVARALLRDVDLSLAPGSLSVGVTRFRLQAHESLQAALHRLAQAFAFALTDDAEGRVLLFALPARVSASAALTVGRLPLLEVELRTESIVEWRDQIECRGQRALVAGDLDNATASQIAASLQGPGVTARPSRLVMPNRSATSRADAANLVAWEASRRAGLTFQAVVRLDRWLDPGTVLRLRDPDNGVNRVLVVQSMNQDVAAAQERYVATLVPVQVYQRKTAFHAIPEAAA